MQVFALLLLAVAFVPTPAQAGPAEDAAVRAAEVRDEYCADIFNERVSLQAGSLREVASAWELVSQAYDASPELYLLYWRGTLAQCLNGFDDTARADLETFWRGSAGDPALAAQRRDAETRLRRLGVRMEQTRDAGRPALGVGIALIAGGGGAAGLAGWQRGALAQAEGAYVAPGASGEDRSAARVDGEAAATATNVLLGSAVGLGVASLPLLVADGVRHARGSRAQAADWAPLVAPTGAGVVVGVVGRW